MTMDRAEARDLLGLGGSALSVTDAVSFLLRQVEGTAWLVPDYLPAGSCCVVGGQPKSCKSYITLDLALAVVAGGDWLGKPVETTGRVLLVDCETPDRALQDRIKSLAAGRTTDNRDLERLLILDKTHVDLADADSVSSLQAVVAEHEPTLIIMDPLRSLHSAEENDAGAMSGVLVALRELTHVCNSTLVLVHHTIKSTESGRRMGALLRGSSALHAWLDAMLLIKREGDTITVEAQGRHAPDQAPITVNLDIDSTGPSPVARINVVGLPAFLAARADEVLALLLKAPGGLNLTSIRDQLRANSMSVRRALAELRERDLARCTRIAGMDVWKASVESS